MTYGTRSVVVAGFVAALGAGVLATSQAPPPASGGKARELSGLLKTRKLESFATRDAANPSRFVAVMTVPDVQLLVVGASYSRPTDIEFYLYQKDYRTAYRELRSGSLASDRFVVEDYLSDGLVAVPAKDAAPDAVGDGDTQQVFEGFADPRKRNDKRQAQEPYLKAFGEADQKYAALLEVLVAAIKKG
jgi:hypothetical protein